MSQSSVFCWGLNSSYQLGVKKHDEEAGEMEDFDEECTLQSPVLQKHISDLPFDVIKVASGVNHTLFLMSSAEVYACGSNEFGQLGRDTTEYPYSALPKKVEGALGSDGTIIDVSSGENHCVAVTQFGQVYCWGANNMYQCTVRGEAFIQTPLFLKALAHEKAIQVSCGSHHTLVLTRDCKVFSWGSNRCGQLGTSITNKCPDPLQVTALVGVPVKHVSCGGKTSCCLTSEGFLVTWGSNEFGQLGRDRETKDNTQDVPSYSIHPKVVPNLASYSAPIVFVSVGQKHVCALDLNGKIWSFGSNFHYELGYESSSEVNVVPRTIMEFAGSKVTQVACGVAHTMALVDGKISACGDNSLGQLGVGHSKLSNLLKITPLKHDWLLVGTDMEVEGNEGVFLVKEIFSGYDSTFATTTTSTDEVVDHTKGICLKSNNSTYKLLQSDLDCINELLADEFIDCDLMSRLELSVHSTQCWNQSFVDQTSPRGFDAHRIDWTAFKTFLESMEKLKRDTVVDMMKRGIEQVTGNLPTRRVSGEALRVYILLTQTQQFISGVNPLKLHVPFAKAFQSITPKCLKTLGDWLTKSVPLEIFANFVTGFVTALNKILSTKPDISDVISENAVQFIEPKYQCLFYLLRQLHTINKWRQDHLPPESFYVSEISKKICLVQDYLKFAERNAGNIQLTHKDRRLYSDYPFLFNCVSKVKLFRADAVLTMNATINSSMNIFHQLFSHLPCLDISVRRENIVSDTLMHFDALLASGEPNNFKLPLKVEFIGEAGQDEGGLKKEFFLLLMRDILSPNYGLFVEFEESRLLWFNEFADASDLFNFQIIGIICGIAIYNSVTVEFPFPECLYKKLLNQDIILEDLKEMNPTVAKNLQVLLDYEGEDVEEMMSLNFTVTRETFGEMKSIELKKGGEDINVTSSNKKEYVDLMVDFYLNKSVSRQYQEFHRGFNNVIGGPIVQLFQPSELMALLTGIANYDWNDFESVTKYQQPYSKDHPTVTIFWQVFHELTQESKKKFLHFLTGCDRVPVLGMKSIKMTIAHVSNPHLLPVAHTCVCQLDLPEYATKERLRYKLLQAIQHYQGFGLV